MRLEDLQTDARVRGITVDGVASIVSVDWSGNHAVNVVYRDPRGALGERLLYRDDESVLELDAGGRPWSFDGSGDLLRLVSEAHRFRLAWLFDPFVAISTSAIEPLPHQISAVYEEMMPRLPLRFLLADDPGAGKTIMAGLLIREMLVRGDLQRCLIVAPGSLTEQWQDELSEKFGLQFELLTRDMITASRTENPFEHHPRLIARMDQLSRNENLQERFKAADEWDLVIVDEAHRMSAGYLGGELKRTKRYLLGQVIGGHCRNFLLMTATPHNGHEESFQLFLALLDGDRFEGKYQDGVHKQDPSDLMRRMIKEELVRFDGTPLFPERKSYTAVYELSPREAHLYAEVTEYVRTQMNLADRIVAKGDARRLNVGFALMTLQRRLASSPKSILRSLERRRERLESRISEEHTLLRGRLAGEGLSYAAEVSPADDLDELYDESPQEELEELEGELIDNATAARSIEELKVEVEVLKRLEELASGVVDSGQDAKWNELQDILENPLMVGADGDRRKLVLFSEFRDTLSYLSERIREFLGRDEAVVEIHGGVGREERRKIVHEFMNDPEVLVLVANDAAGEGVNLQRAHLMVNYDLPWNPNRLEQRFGRIHRIGQREVCHLWNLIAKDTREGDVYLKLLKKLEAEAESLQGKVFDVLGQLFDQNPLRKLLEDAILYGDRPEVRARLDQQMDGAFDKEHIQGLLEGRALAHDTMDTSKVAAIKEQMDRAEARKLQPHFIEAFFRDAFVCLGGKLRPREPGRYEITHVPQPVRERDRQIGSGAPILRRYERICFEKDKIAVYPRAELVCLGHPLLDSTIDLTIERHGEVLKRGAVLVDDQDPGEQPRLLFYLKHAVQDGELDRTGKPRTVSNRLHFLEIDAGGQFQDAGSAPYLDYRPVTEEEAEIAAEVLDDDWMRRDWDRDAVRWASAELVPKHLAEIREYRLPGIEKVENEVRARLTEEISVWSAKADYLREKERAGSKTRLPASQAEHRAQDLADRLRSRESQLARERALTPQQPRLIGGALILPAGLLRRSKDQQQGHPDDGVDAEARKRVELLAMGAVMDAERALGRSPRDVSATKGIGYDIESHDPGGSGGTLFIEVKGRVEGASSITLTANEVRCAMNVSDRFRLAIVQVQGDQAAKPVYVRDFDYGQPVFLQTSSTYSLSSLLEYGAPPE